MKKIKKKLSSIFKSDIVRRIFWTFIEGFLGGFYVTISTTSNYNTTIFKSACIGGLAAAISAIKNLIANYIRKKKEDII